MVVTIKAELLLATSVKMTNLWPTVKRPYIYIHSKHNEYLQHRLFSIIRCKSRWDIAAISGIYRKNGIIISAGLSQSRWNPYKPSDAEKKAMLLFKGGEDMKTLFQHVGKVFDTDTYEEAVKKISDGLSERTNKVIQRNVLLSNFPQGSKSFEKWSQEVSNATKLISYDNYD